MLSGEHGADAATADERIEPHEKSAGNVSDPTAEIEQLRSLLAAKDQQLEEKDKEVEELRSSIQGAEDYISGLESEVDKCLKLSEQVERLEKELEQARNGHDADDAIEAPSISHQRGVSDRSILDHDSFVTVDEGGSSTLRRPRSASSLRAAVDELWTQLLDHEIRAAEMIDTDDDLAVRKEVATKLKAMQTELSKEGIDAGQVDGDVDRSLTLPTPEHKTELDEALQLRSDENDTLRKELEAAKANAAALRDELDGMQKDADDLARGLDQGVNAARQEADALRIRVADLESLLEEASSRAVPDSDATFTLRIEELEGLRRKDEELIRSQKEEIALLEQQIEQAEKAVEEFETKFVEFEQRRESETANFMEQIQALAAEKANTDQKLLEANVETDRLRDQLRSHADMRDIQLQGEQELKVELDWLRKELETTKVDMEASHVAEIESKASELTVLSARVNELSDELKSQQDVAQKSAEDVTGMQTRLADSEEQNRTLSEHVTELTKELAEARERATQLESSITETEEAKDRAFETLTASYQEVQLSEQQLRDKCQDLERQLAEKEGFAAAEAEQSAASVLALETSKAQAIAEAEQLRHQLARLGEDKDKVEREKEHLKLQLLELENEVTHFKEASEVDLENANARIEELLAQLTGISSEQEAAVTEVQQKLADAQAECVSAKERLLEQEARFEQSCSTNAKIQEELEQSLTQVEQLKANVVELQTARDILKGKAEDISREYVAEKNHAQQLEGEIEQLRLQLQDHERSRDLLDQQDNVLLDKANAQIASMQRELEERNEELHTLRASLTVADTSSRELASRVEMLEQDRDGQVGQNTALTARAQALEETITARDHELLGCKTAIQDLETALAEKSATLESINNDLVSRGAALKAKEDEVEALSSQVQAFETEIGTHAQQLNELRDKVGSLQDALVSAQQELEVRQAELDSQRSVSSKSSVEQEEVVGRLREDLDSRINDIATLTERIALAEAERQAAVQLRSELEAERENHRSLQDDFEALQQRVQLITTEYDKAIEDKTALEAELGSREAATENIQILNQKLATTEQDLQQKAEALSSVQSNLENLQRERENAETQLTEAHSSVEELETIVQNLRTQLSLASSDSENELRGELEAAIAKVEQLTVDLESARNDRDRVAEESLKATLNLRKRIAELEEERDVLQEPVTSSRNISDDDQTEMNDELLSKHEAKEAEVQELQARAVELENAAERLRVATATHDTDRAEIQAMLDARNVDVAHLREEVNDLQQQLRHRDEAVNTLKQELAGLEAEVQQKVRKQVECEAEAAASISALNNLVHGLEETVRTKDATLVEREQSLEGNERTLQTVREQNESLIAQVQELSHKPTTAEVGTEIDDSQMSDILQLYRKQIAEVVSERKALQSQLDSLQESCNGLNKDTESLRARVAELEGEVEKRGELQKQLEAEVTRLQAALQEAEREPSPPSSPFDEEDDRGRSRDSRYAGRSLSRHRGKSGVRSVSSRRSGTPTPMSPISIIDTIRELAIGGEAQQGGANGVDGIASEPSGTGLPERERQELLRMIEILSMHISAADEQLEEDRETIARLQASLESARRVSSLAGNGETMTGGNDTTTARMKLLQARVDAQLDEIANMEYEMVKARSLAKSAQERVTELEAVVKEQKHQLAKARTSSPTAANIGNGQTKTRRKDRNVGTSTLRLTPGEMREILPSVMYDELTNGPRRGSSRLLGDSSGRREKRGSAAPSVPTKEKERATPTSGPSINQLLEETQQKQKFIGELGQELSACRRHIRELVQEMENLKTENDALKRSLQQSVARPQTPPLARAELRPLSSSDSLREGRHPEPVAALPPQQRASRRPPIPRELSMPPAPPLLHIDPSIRSRPVVERHESSPVKKKKAFWWTRTDSR